MPAPPPDRTPRSSYRLQLHGGFTLRDAARVVPYLTGLGITEIYTSPILAATPGSTHGYDICDHSRINPELGGDEALLEFTTALRQHNLGWIVDFVPNHMGIDLATNLWWRDVLENGPSSPYARFFDIDWEPVKKELREKLLLPILGDQYGLTLHRGQFRLSFDGESFSVQYFDHSLPLNPRQLRILLRHNMEHLQADTPPDDPELIEFLSILFHLDHMPSYAETNPFLMEERRREKDVARRRLVKLVAESPRIRAHIEENIRIYNGTPGNPTSFDLLHELLEAQAYRLSSWRTAMHEINYRRFFDINELAGLRMEDPAVFAAAHERILQLVRDNAITGIRLDHVDGLFDPPGYFRQLSESCGADRQMYIVAEKILTEGEHLRQDWVIHGTTGYDFLNQVNALYVQSGNVREFRKLYARVTGIRRAFRDIVYISKKLIIETSMAAELNVLAHELNRISESNRQFRDFTLDSLTDALSEVVACFPVYRTYFNSDGWDSFDERNVETAVNDALRRNPAVEPSIFEFIRQMLLPIHDPDTGEAEFQRRARFAMKLQQYTSPVQAKGVEDTAFYRYGPLLSLNEVGGEPGRFGHSVSDFHSANADRLRDWPLSMLASASHDTKRGEDARARLNVLSEMPQQWREAVSRFMRINSSARTLFHGEPAPDRSDEYLYYQALLGAWPPGPDNGPPEREFIDRVKQYMSKATKEKKTHTSWINPSAEYDSAVAQFVERTLAGTRAEAFLQAFLPFQKRLSFLGMINSLSQLLIKLTSPGVPDTYQGCELWDFSLVDPDNRRPVDFDLRSRQLRQMLPLLDSSASHETLLPSVAGMLASWQNGCIKQYLLATALRLRLRHPDLFLRGAYTPVSAEGVLREHVVAFARSSGPMTLLTIAPRLVAGLVGDGDHLPTGSKVWSETVLPLPRQWQTLVWRDALTGQEHTSEGGGTLPLARILDTSPIALLLASTPTNAEGSRQ